MSPPPEDPAGRISLGPLSTPGASAEEAIALASALGTAVGFSTDQLDEAESPEEVAARAAEADVAVSHLFVSRPVTLDDPERWPDERDELGRAMDLALALRPDVVVLPTGAAGSLTWERAADALEEVLHGTVREAEREGMTLALEPTPPQLDDVGFVHTLRDAVELGWRLGTGVCFDVETSGTERNLFGTLSAAIDTVALVQVADRRRGTRAVAERTVPGEGSLPLRRILGQLLELDYAGWFDLELTGRAWREPGIDRRAALDRGVTALRGLLAEAAGGGDPIAPTWEQPERP